jgi:hypothetical protein
MKKAADFKHRTQKVGARKLIPASSTQTSFKWTRLVTDSRSNEGPLADDAHSSLEHIVAACRNHNAGSRSDGLMRLALFAVKCRPQVEPNLSRIVAALADRICDPEAAVRASLASALPAVLGACQPASALVHVPLLATYLSSALSKLQPALRLDALALVRLISRALPTARPVLCKMLFTCVCHLLEPQLHPLTCMSYAGSHLPADLALGKRSSTASRGDHRSSRHGVTGSPNDSLVRVKLDSSEARLVVASVLLDLLAEPPDRAAGLLAACPHFAPINADWGLHRRLRVLPARVSRPADTPCRIVASDLDDFREAFSFQPVMGIASAPRLGVLSSPGVAPSDLLHAARLLLQVRRTFRSITMCRCPPPPPPLESKPCSFLFSQSIAAVAGL